MLRFFARKSAIQHDLGSVTRSHQENEMKPMKPMCTSFDEELTVDV